MERENAINILKACKVVREPGIAKNVTVSNVSFEDTEGNPWTWERTGDEYAIVNLMVVNPYGLNKAKKALADEDYDGACNNNLSARVTPELGKQLQSIGMANITLGIVTTSEGDALLIKKVSAVAPMECKTISDELLGIVDEVTTNVEENSKVKEEDIPV